MKKLGTLLGVIIAFAIIGYRIYVKIKPKLLKDDFATVVLTINEIKYGNDVKYLFPTDFKHEYIYENGKQTDKAVTNYVEFIKKCEIPKIENAIAKVKNVSSTDPDFQPITDRSLDFLNTSKKFYETDMLKLAELKDKKAPESEIAKLQELLMNKGNSILLQKKEALYQVAIPYADKNEIKYTKVNGNIGMQF